MAKQKQGGRSADVTNTEETEAADALMEGKESISGASGDISMRQLILREARRVGGAGKPRAERIVAALFNLAESTSISPQTRLVAINTILDRIDGRPLQTSVTASIPVDPAIQIRQVLDRAKQLLGVDVRVKLPPGIAPEDVGMQPRKQVISQQVMTDRPGDDQPVSGSVPSVSSAQIDVFPTPMSGQPDQPGALPPLPSPTPDDQHGVGSGDEGLDGGAGAAGGGERTTMEPPLRDGTGLAAYRGSLIPPPPSASKNEPLRENPESPLPIRPLTIGLGGVVKIDGKVLPGIPGMTGEKLTKEEGKVVSVNAMQQGKARRERRKKEILEIVRRANAQKG